MTPPEPETCRRENQRRWWLSLLPPLICGLLLFTGSYRAAAVWFGTAWVVICWGTLAPRSRLFGPHQAALSAEAAQRGEVWITLDDGPDPVTTPALLDLLDRYHAKAGFFLIGAKAARHPELVRDIAARGHVIGNHTQTHPAAAFWCLHPRRMWQEIAGAQSTLTALLGTPPVWFRPPVGHHNPFVFPPLRALGLTMAQWNCRGYDGVACDPHRVLQRIEAGLKPGAIVLLHDGNASALPVLEGTLQRLAALGLRAALPSGPSVGSVA